MPSLMRIPLEGGGSILVEADPTLGGGPIKAGRADDVIESARTTLQAALGSVADAARAVRDQLKEAGPQEIEVEFGVEFTAQAGAVIVKSLSGCHLTVTLTWKSTAAADPPSAT